MYAIFLIRLSDLIAPLVCNLLTRMRKENFSGFRNLTFYSSQHLFKEMIED